MVTDKTPSYWHGWAPNNKEVVYVGQRDGKNIYHIYRNSIDGGKEVQLTHHTSGHVDGPEYSPDGKYIYYNGSQTGTMQLWRMKPDGTGNEQLTFDENNNWFPHLSPDGKWIAFASDQSGRDEVYVRSLAPGGEQLLVSLEGGVEPVRNPSGGEVFYRETRAANARLVAARIETTPRLRVASRTPLFPIDDIVGTNPHANYDVSPDGTTFVLVRRSPSARIVVIQNFPALIRKLQGKNAR